MSSKDDEIVYYEVLYANGKVKKIKPEKFYDWVEKAESSFDINSITPFDSNDDIVTGVDCWTEEEGLISPDKDPSYFDDDVEDLKEY